MKKSKQLTKICAAAILSAVCCASFAAPNTAIRAEAAKIDNSVSVQNIAINGDYKSLTISSSGKLTCYGKTVVQSGYYAGVTVELQKYDGDWYTVKSWSNSGSASAEVSEPYSADKGYSYRLRVTHKAYNSSWGLVESFVRTTNIVSYN